MKKITLSAAVVALAMMGCSDAGLDNSVASTSEVKSEQVQQNVSLLKQVQNKLPNEYLNNGVNQSGYNRYNFDRFNIGLELQSYVTSDLRSRGEFNMLTSTLPGEIHIVTVGVVGCRVFPKQQNPQELDVECNIVDSSVDHGAGANMVVETKRFEHIPRGLIGSVSSFAAVWGPDKIFTTSTYSGNLDYTTAYLVYQKYLMKAYNEDLQNH